MPRVSVVIPTHNRPNLLPRAVESAWMAGRDVEVIVVDDASTDATAEVCRKLPGIKHIRLARRQGAAGARNIGILASTAEYVAFLDDDDLRLNGSLDEQCAVLESDPAAGFVCGPMLLMDQQGSLTGETLSPRSAGGDVFWKIIELDFFLLPSSVVIRKACFFRVGLFNARIPGIDDWDLWARVAELYPAAVTSGPVGIYRAPTPFSAQGSSALGAHLYRAARHQKHLLNLPRALASSGWARRQAKTALRRRIADTLSLNAARQFPKGAYAWSLKNFLLAMRLSPFWAARPNHLRELWRSARSG